MKRSRITIAHLIVVVLVAAIGLAAIRRGTAAWAGAMLSITFFAMICSLLGVALERGTRRIYWLGFATLGWGYLLLAYLPWLDDKVGQFLLAPTLFAYLYELLQTDSQGGGGLQSLPLEILGATATGGGFGGGMAGPLVVSVLEFQRIGVALEALLWAFLGGWVACYFASGRDRATHSDVAGRQGPPEAQRQGPGDDPMPRATGPTA
jgi:hypothetical protein